MGTQSDSYIVNGIFAFDIIVFILFIIIIVCLGIYTFIKSLKSNKSSSSSRRSSVASVYGDAVNGKFVDLEGEIEERMLVKEYLEANATTLTGQVFTDIYKTNLEELIALRKIQIEQFKDEHSG